MLFSSVENPLSHEQTCVDFFFTFCSFCDAEEFYKTSSLKAAFSVGLAISKYFSRFVLLHVYLLCW
jgi:hypothetical protein